MRPTDYQSRVRTIEPPDDLSDLIGSDELAIFEGLWSSHLAQCLVHWLRHSIPRSEAEALRNLETFFPQAPPVFRRAAARLYTLTSPLF